MKTPKPRRGPCRHDQAEFITVDFKHTNIFGRDGYTERARCYCRYSIRGAAYPVKPTGDQLAEITTRMRRSIAQHGTNHFRRHAICIETLFEDILRALNPPTRTAQQKTRKLPG